MDAKKWIKWADFDDDGEDNGKWCIGEGGNHVAVAVTVGATEQEADILAAAPELLSALEDALLASGFGVDAPIPEEIRYSVPAWVFKAREVVTLAKGGTR